MEGKRIDLVSMAKKKRHIHLVEKLSKRALTPGEIKELEKFEKSPLSPGIVETQGEVAKAFGKTKRTVENWKDSGMPVREDGMYELIMIAEWYYKRKFERKFASNKVEKESLDIDLKRIKVAEADLRLKERMGELISHDEVKKERVARIMTVERVMFAVPRQVAAVLAAMTEPQEIEVYLTDKMRDICNAFAGKK